MEERSMKKVLVILLTVLMLTSLTGVAFAASKTVKVKSVSLNKTSLTLNVGDSSTLKASVNPSNASDKKVTWSSNNAKIAKVDSNGKVTGVAAGSATITAKSSNGKTASCKVTVKSVAVSSVSLNSTKLTIKAGASSTLKATLKPTNATDKKVTWSSSNTNVAKVDSNGKVTGVKAGTATITAKSSNGKTAACKVTVTAAAATSVKLNKTSIDFAGKPVTLTATVSPAGAEQKVTWSSSNTKVAKVDSNGKVTPVGYGSCKITAKTSNGKTAVCNVTVNKEIKITRSYTIAEEWPYLIKDSFDIYVDGKTGKITHAYVRQTTRDAVIVGVITGKGTTLHISGDGSYVSISSTYGITVGVGVKGFKIGVEVIERTNYYKVYADGTVKLTGGNCNDLAGICRQY